ncbi:unnamed protein product [Paramecium primaurelia]|uniref:Xaa-Pro aminopeptidase n=1 Tax=Paramecium primaurelia TaxID=5886 RepID=A0A8S1L7G0_PARPR|nr:unnamed protein product [Paramecium primaurelia]
MQKINNKLNLLRELMAQRSIQAYLVPHSDAHDSEYTSDSDERLAFISGFDGSAGIGLITNTIAYLWTDSRYYLQATKQLEHGWELQKLEPGVPTWVEHAKANLKGQAIGYDPLLISHQLKKTRGASLEDVEFKAINENLIDLIWTNKPQDSLSEVIIHELEYHQYPTTKKISQIFENLKQKQAKSILISKLDQIAWVLNLRGNDIKFNPLFKSYLYLKDDNTGTLFINPTKINQQVKQYLTENNIEIKSIQDVFNEKFINAAVTPAEINHRLIQQVEDPIVLNACPIELLKAIKNEREIQGFKESHIRDGAALVHYLGWLEKQLLDGEVLDEYQAATKLAQYRYKQSRNMGLSFDSISSSGANAAIVHYHPTENNKSIINPNHIYLIDSGGQYLDGTTDVTRTYHFTQPTVEERNAYTRVLLGNLDIERLKWPQKSKIHGGDIDVLARRWLWEANLDYGHGTGHGVGYFLNVHEGPHGISKYRTEVFQPGMIVSNEPGYYEEGKFGIRIENLILCVKVNNQFLGFENLTYCPYDRNLINLDLLSPRDRNYIDQYHALVRKTLLPLMEEQIAKDWLIKMTEPL